MYRTQLRERRQRAVETLPELGQDVRRLANLAYPTAPNDVRETLAKEQCIDSLIDGDMQLRIKQARPINLNDAIRHAVELEAFNKAELNRNEGGGYLRSAAEQETKDETATLLKTMQQALTDLQTEVKGLKSKQTPRDQNLRQCHACGKPGHIARFCPRGDVTCYGCGEKGNVVRFCPKGRRQNQNGGRQKGRNNDDQGKTDTTPVTSDKTPGSVGVHKLAPEAGMFIRAKVNGVITNLLIDTGATVTLISTVFFKDMSNMPTLSSSQRDILTANGESLKVAGKTIIEIQSDTFKCLSEAVDADINVDGILGLDFLNSQHAEIDMCNNTIKIQGHKVQFNIQGQIGCYRDFSNEEQLKTHLLQCVKEMTQFTCEVCSQVFMKRHMKNIHGQVPNTGPKVVEVNKKDEGSDKESSDEDSQEDDDIEKYNSGELIGDISDDGDNHDDDKHEKPKSSDQTDLKGTSDLELGRTQRKSCSPRPVAAPVKRKLDV